MTATDQSEARAMLLHWERYYTIEPHCKTIQDCANHGADHRAYGWARLVDPRWNAEQTDAYLAAYGQAGA